MVVGVLFVWEEELSKSTPFLHKTPLKNTSRRPWGDPKDSGIRNLLTLLRTLMVWCSQKRF
jgi:hypothetical protein